MEKYSLTAESVTPGHPDKLADLIADTILDAILEKDKYGRVACEVFVSKGYVIVGGEITTQARIDINGLVRETILKVGYDKPAYGFDGHTVGVLNTVSEQSPDIAQGVRSTATKKQGAGDQGVMIGYATDETPEFMPLPILLAHRLTMRLTEIRKRGQIAYLRPDGKSQVTLEYEKGKAQRISSVVIAASHEPEVSPAQLKKEIIEQVIQPVCGDLLDQKTDYYINNTGRFVICGPVSDTGMSGRKNVVDAYGPQIPIGGGSFSGKDPTKIDRSAAYMARYIAKNIVAAGLARRCLVRLAYVIGGTKPLEIAVETFGTSQFEEEKLKKAVLQIFDLSPGGILKELDLLRPIYRKTTCFGHFGRPEPEFTWEKKDKVATLQDYFKL
jgi:S-adenosylmethionine synthetase